MSAPLTPEERPELDTIRDALDALGSRYDMTRARAYDALRSLAAALEAVEQERDAQIQVSAEYLESSDANFDRAEAAEREVVRLKATLIDVCDQFDGYTNARFSEQGISIEVELLSKMREQVFNPARALASVSGADATEEQE